MKKNNGYLPCSSFELIETFRFTSCPGISEPLAGYYLLSRHVDRLGSSARFFGFPYTKALILEALEDTATRILSGTGEDEMCHYRVRLLLGKTGAVRITCSLMGQDRPSAVKFDLSDLAVCSKDTFLYHKTTCRPVYRRERKRITTTDLFETVFTNERGQLTEGTISNLFLRFEPVGRLLTPPVASGLLNGTLRAELLAQRRAIECVLYPNDLLAASEIFLGNSVRGLLKAQFVPAPGCLPLASNPPKNLDHNPL